VQARLRISSVPSTMSDYSDATESLDISKDFPLPPLTTVHSTSTFESFVTAESDRTARWCIFFFFFLLSLIKYLSLTVLGISFAWCSFVPTFLELVTHLLAVTFCICPEAYPFEPHFAPIPQYIHNNWPLRLESNMRILFNSSFCNILPFNLCSLPLLLLFFLYGSLLTCSGYAMVLMVLMQDSSPTVRWTNQCLDGHSGVRNWPQSSDDVQCSDDDACT